MNYFKLFSRVKSTQDVKVRFIKGNELKINLCWVTFIFSYTSVQNHFSKLQFVVLLFAKSGNCKCNLKASTLFIVLTSHRLRCSCGYLFSPENGSCCNTLNRNICSEFLKWWTLFNLTLRRWGAILNTENKNY